MSLENLLYKLQTMRIVCNVQRESCCAMMPTLGKGDVRGLVFDTWGYPLKSKAADNFLADLCILPDH